MNFSRRVLYILFVCAFVTSALNAQTLSYPELLVTPSASERLLQEAKEEKDRAWIDHLPMQAAALSSFTAGVIAFSRRNEEQGKEDTMRYAGLSAMATGLTWIGVTTAMASMYEPYRDAYKHLKSMPDKGERDRLSKERAAEEALYGKASLMKKMRWIAVVTNAAAGLGVATAGEDRMSQAVGSFAVFAALLPVIWPYRAETIAEYHRDYKKRIYGPLAALEFDLGIADAKPTLSASLRF